MKLTRVITKIKKSFHVATLRANVSYSQAGEDIILNYLFNSLGIKTPFYIDVGANEPMKGNNTYFFYQAGSHGICIEPNSVLANKLRKQRPKDTVLNIGIATDKKTVSSFYTFPDHYHAWNTFSLEEAQSKQHASGVSFSTQEVETDTLNNIVEQLSIKKIHLLSIDVEGLDLAILKSIDFSAWQPDVVCVETIAFSITNTLNKQIGIVEFLDSKGYTVYADTGLNTIFCKKDIFS
jgi:FkbM family methyltransferase